MNSLAFSIPTLMILIPFAGGLVTMSMLGRRSGLITSLVVGALNTALIVLGACALNGHGVSRLVMSQRHSWFAQWHVFYSVRLSEVPLGLIALVTIVTVCATICTFHMRRERAAALMGVMWLTAACLDGLFVSRDLVLFYSFFELMLVPSLIAVGVWGGEHRIRATLTMFVYTLTGSLIMLVAVIGVGVRAGTFDLDGLARAGATGGTFTWWMFAAFVLAFAIKAPLPPFHGWLPIAYRQAPAEVTAILSGVLSKAAMFGMLIIVLPLFPGYMAGDWGKVVIWLGIAGLLYGSIGAFRQADARGVIAYSSIAQMGLIFLGLAVYRGAGASQGIDGSVLQSFNHGLLSATLFFIIGILELRLGSSDLKRLGGLGAGRPVLVTLVLITCMCALAVPGSNGFAGELLVLAGAFHGPWAHAWIFGSVASVAVVLAAMYMLRFIAAILHNPGHDTTAAPPPGENGESSAAGDFNAGAAAQSFGRDLRWGELAVIAPTIIGILLLSVWPNITRGALKHATPVALNGNETTSQSVSPPSVKAAPAAPSVPIGRSQS